MTNKIKALGLAFVAAAAMSAVVASAGQAAELHIGSDPAVLTGHSEDNQILTINKTNGGGAFNSICGTATFEGTTEGLSITSATVTPTYEKCKLFGLAASVKMNGCKYTLNGEGQPALTALVDITGCTAGKSIEVKSATCTLDIPAQTGLSHVVASNPTTDQVTVNATVTNITVTQTGAGCPDGNNHHSNNGSFTGNIIFNAFEDKEIVEANKHGHAYTEHICGDQVSLLAT